MAEKADVLNLLKVINRHIKDGGGEPLEEQLLGEMFELLWPQLEVKLNNAAEIPAPVLPPNQSAASVTLRDERKILDEILELVRNQQRRLSDIEERLESSPRSAASKPADSNDFYKQIRVNIIGEIPDAGDFYNRVSNSWRQRVPGVAIGLSNTHGREVMVVTFPYPMDEDYVDDLLRLVASEVGIKWGGYSASTA